MPAPDLTLPEIYLGPGEVFLACVPTIIGTILGSCVGMTFWCSRLGVGALCHCTLPRCPDPATQVTSMAAGYRYVDSCIRNLASEFDRLGALRCEVEVKLFGGADVLFVDHLNRRPTVGKQNSEAAIQVLGDEGYRVAAFSVGDTFGRKISFNTANGEVRVLRLT